METQWIEHTHASQCVCWLIALTDLLPLHLLLLPSNRAQHNPSFFGKLWPLAEKPSVCVCVCVRCLSLGLYKLWAEHLFPSPTYWQISCSATVGATYPRQIPDKSSAFHHQPLQKHVFSVWRWDLKMSESGTKLLRVSQSSRCSACYPDSCF